MNLEQRATEISDFLGVPYGEALDRLGRGFHYNHAKVAEDFNKKRPANDDDLLEWYRTTDAYIWELSAYHLESGFNYMGMCGGAATHLKTEGKQVVLALGDGVGDLSATLAEAGLNPVYHDLSGSKTAEFAMHSLAGEVAVSLSMDWSPPNGEGHWLHDNKVDAIVAWDFFEHLTEVEKWARACYDMLNPGGIFQAQNAFAIGDEEHGDSIPMHLTRNNRFEHDWIPLLKEIGFTDLKNGWHQK